MRIMTDLAVQGKCVLVRVDFNVPLDENGHITDTTRIRATIPTLRHLLSQRAKIIILSHLDRPKGKKDASLSLKPCAAALSTFLEQEVLFAEDCLSENTKKQIALLQEKEILLLENLRFYAAEEDPSCDPSFAKTLASYGDFYINDAFGVAHRKHSSTYTIASYFPGRAAIGFLMQKEIDTLRALHDHPPAPFHLILGGAKVSSKMGVLQSLFSKAESIYIGGAMAFTFLAAQSIPIGDSFYEKDCLESAKKIIENCIYQKITLLLPIDIIVFNGSTHATIQSQIGIEKGWKGVDIGPKTCSLWKENLRQARSVFWNGPLGLFERPPFDAGTYEITRFLATLSAEKVVGGGDSVAAIHAMHLTDAFTHISTGGGASLEFLEKGTLPGIQCIV